MRYKKISQLLILIYIDKFTKKNKLEIAKSLLQIGVSIEETTKFTKIKHDEVILLWANLKVNH